MTRIAVALHPEALVRRRLVTEMLAAFGSARSIVDAGMTTIGCVGATPGGVRERNPFAVVLDGVIYSYPGSSRAANSSKPDDPELLVDVIAERGLERVLPRINGDFSFAWVDARRPQVSIARDLFGTRPLYYARIDGGWIAASQLRQILQVPEISSDPDPGYLVRYGAMHYRAIDHDPSQSPIAAIRQVPAAAFVTLDLEGHEPRSVSYWDGPKGEDSRASESELAEEYRELVIEAVRIRMRRFPRRSFTLSGGMDSSSVLAAAVNVDGSRQTAFSSVYEDPTYDERSDIADMLAQHVSDWRPVAIPNQFDLVHQVDRLIDLHDEPIATATWFSHLLVVEAAAESGCDALFGGLGGDELNAGEYEYFPFFFADLRVEGLDDALQREVEAWVINHDHPVFRKSKDVATAAVERLVDLAQPGRCLIDQERLGRYLHTLAPDRRASVDPLRLRDTRFTSYLKARTWQDLTRETLPCCIRAEDRNGSRVGLPSVRPFLDPNVVEFAYRVPGRMKIRDGVTKHLLRRAMGDLLPAATRDRIKKTGWNAPAHLWFVGPGAEVLRDLVDSEAFERWGIYERAAVMGVIDEHERVVSSGRPAENHMMFLWQFLNLMRWLVWLEGGASRSPVVGAAG